MAYPICCIFIHQPKTCSAPDHSTGLLAPSLPSTAPKGACHTCGQPVSPNIIHERGEILRVSQTVAEAQLTRAQREATVARRSLELSRDKADLVGELRRLEREQREALGRKRESREELVARRDELR